jgi:hypothetical protein
MNAMEKMEEAENWRVERVGRRARGRRKKGDLRGGSC